MVPSLNHDEIPLDTFDFSEGKCHLMDGQCGKFPAPQNNSYHPVAFTRVCNVLTIPDCVYPVTHERGGGWEKTRSFYHKS
jgi:hypothetical protein